MKSFSGGIMSGIGSVIGKIFSLPGLIAGVIGGISLGSFFSSALSAIDEDEKASAKLGAVLTATGGAAGFTKEQLQGVAKELMNTTTFGDEAIVNGEALLATFRNIKGDVFKDATKAMLDMSIVMDQDVKSSAVQIGKALNNPIKGLTSLQKIGVSFTDQQKDQIKTMTAAGDVAGAQAVILKELQAEFGGAAEAVAATGGGQRAQLSNLFGEVMEGAGSVINLLIGTFMPQLKTIVGDIATWLQANAGNIAGKIVGFVQPIIAFGVGAFRAIVSFLTPIVKTIWEFLKTAAKAIFDFVLPIQIAYVGALKAIWNAVVSIVSGLISAVMSLLPAGFSVTKSLSEFFGSLKEAIILSLITIEFGLNNWSRVVEFVFTAGAASIITFVNQVQYFFTVVLPSVLSWLSQNWQDVLTDLFNFQTTVFTNMVKNIVNIFKNIPGLIKGSVSFADLWTPITEGFETVIKDLPDIPAREIGALEQTLHADADRMQANLGKDFDAFVQKRLGEIDQTASDITNGLTNLFSFDGPALETPKLPDLKIAPEAQDTIDSVAASAKLGAAEVGRFSIAGLLPSPRENGMDKLNKTAEKQISATEEAGEEVASAIRDTFGSIGVASFA